MDSRLIGTWKSDAKRTAREIAARRDIQASKKGKLRSLFGKLELRYTFTLKASTIESAWGRFESTSSGRSEKLFTCVEGLASLR
jgi:hypothetical protein